jgi:DNA-binding CsgD family transcriptional regulator/tetratricopeptide (TPR) repeat protein
MLLEHTLVCPVLVGRTAPLEAFGRALRGARGRGGGTVLVSGEAGVGKSRVLRAAAEAARGEGFLVLQGASFEADRALPFGPLLDLVRGFAAATSPAVAAHAFAPAVPELLALFPELAGVIADGEPAPPTDPEHGRRRLFHAILQALDLLARRQPLLLVFEDVHWSDDATLDLLHHLARGLNENAVVLALSYRSDEIGPRLGRLLAELDRARLAAELPLACLTTDEVATMLRAIFGDDAALGEGFTGLLHDLTEGNPFFVEEVLKALVVAGDVAPTAEGRWRARPLERVHVPRSAIEAVRRRLSGLSGPARELASMAAVVGRRFDFALLQAITDHDEPTLLALVKELIAAQLVVDESADRIAFRHALTREAIYAELLARERVALHRQVTQAIERLHAPSLDSVVETLAYHTFEAGEWARARGYAARAAEHALALFAPREALAHLNRAVAAARREGIAPDAALLMPRGRASETLGDFDAALEDFSTVLRAARAEGNGDEEWQAQHALGMLWAARDYTRAGEARHAALVLARASGDPARIARSLNRVGNWHLNLEQPAPARRCHDEALALLQREGDDRGVAETVDLIAMACHIAGDEAEAVAHYERAAALFAELGNRRGLAAAQALTALCGPSFHCSGTVFGWSEVTPEVLATERPVLLTQEIGWRAGEAFCRFLLADCLAWRGAYDRALRLGRSALAIAEELEHLEWQAGASRVLGVIALDLFAVAEARDRLQRAHAIALQLGSRTWTRWTAAPLSIALARGGEIVGALAILEAVAAPSSLGREALRPGDEDAKTLGERLLRLAHCEVLLAAGNAAEALALVEARIREEHTAAEPPASGNFDRTTVLPRHSLLRGQALLALDRPEEAEAALHRACAEAIAADAPPLLWRAHAALAQSHRALRQRVAARAELDAAGRIAGELAARIPDDRLLAAFRRGVAARIPAPARLSPRQQAKEAYGGLTRREREVATLVAGGNSNRAIARALFIGERTVEDHVAHALAKLDFLSRAQLAAWAVQIGLAPAPPGAAETAPGAVPPTAH